MEDVDSLVRTTLSEIEKVLNTKTVVGEPITIQDTTIVPLITAGFGFGAGAGSGKGESKQKGEGAGGGTGGGAWVKPTAVIILNKDGVRVEPILGSMAGAIEKLGEAVPRMMEKFMETCTQKWGERKKEA